MDKSTVAAVTSDPSAGAAGRPSARGKWQDAVAQHQAGELTIAKRLYQEVLAGEPDHAEALHELGVLEADTGNLPRARELITQAIALRPDAVFHNNLGNVFMTLRQWDEAISHFEQALALQPELAQVYNNRGNALRSCRRFEAAVADYQKALALKPDFAEAWNNLGVALSELRQFAQAVACFGKAIELAPGNVQAYHNRGHALTELKQLAAAVACYDQALKLIPDYPYVAGLRLSAKMHICDWRDLDSELAQLQGGIERHDKMCPPFALLALSSSLSLQRRSAEIWAHETDAVKNALGLMPRRGRGQRIRIGYFSCDFHQHATAYLMAGLFERHDRSRFELIAFSWGPIRDDDMRQRLLPAFDRFLEVGHLDDAAIAALSRSLEVDIAVDLKGYTQGSRPGIFAARAASIQVSYLGYPGTMGADFIDYLIADATVIPQRSRSHYSEKIVTLPHSYQVNDDQRLISDVSFTREQLGLPASGFVYCCFNNNYKITPTTFDLWMRILLQVEGSVLWLLQDSADAAANLRREATLRGVDAQRLVFAQRLPQAQHLARQRAADLFLDTVPCNAHTTASDALWAGLPLLTCVTEAFNGRVAASLLKAMDLPELICSSPQTYEAIAVRLARNPAQLRALRQRLEQDRWSATLFDTSLFAVHIEAAYEKMMDRHNGGLAPDHIVISNHDEIRRRLLAFKP